MLFGVTHFSRVVIDEIWDRAFGRMFAVFWGRAGCGLPRRDPQTVQVMEADGAFMGQLVLEAVDRGATANSVDLGPLDHLDTGALVATLVWPVLVEGLGTPEEVGVGRLLLCIRQSRLAHWLDSRAQRQKHAELKAASHPVSIRE